MVRAFFAVISLWVFASAAAAQQSWVQVEAQPSLREAEERARAYGTSFSDIQGYRVGGNWYALALGPYATPDLARSRLLELRGAGIIPRDSFVADGRGYRDQFWPVGGGNAAPQATNPAPAPQVAETPPPPVDETREEARDSERLLSRQQREQLQVALQWFDYYKARIDGSFGKGTRNSMALWQRDKGYDPHGVLTTKQRAELLGDYSEALALLGLGAVDEEKAGIQITMPTGLVEFSGYDYPFVRFTERDGSGVQVLLISQAGDDTTMGGLYEIMQTLEIVPLEGERSKRRNGFVLTGQNATLQSHTEVTLSGGYVKGFTLAYPPEKAGQMAKVLKIMQDSFATSEGHLEPTDSDEAAQSVDLMAGLELRKPKRSRSGFYVDGRGQVVTVADAVQSCERITLDDTYEAEVSVTGAGLALLTPKDSLVPLNYARFASNLGLLRSTIAVSGYSYEGALPAPSVTYGTLEDLRGLNGDASVKRLEVGALPGDAGGPVLDMSGAVSGILLANEPGGRALPEGTAFATKAGEVARFLSQAGVEVQALENGPEIAAEDLLVAASDMTVLVSCW